MIAKIEKIFLKSGIRDVGFCAFDDIKDRLIDCRAKSRIPENAKTVILCLFPYKVKEERPKMLSRYAAVPDYHKVCMKYLQSAAKMLKETFAENEFEPFIDNSPIPEVEAAARAGLGAMGQNGLLINKKYGSWVFIGEIVCDIEIDCQTDLKNCSMCGDCKTACSIGLRKAECLSAVSQQKKALSDTQKELLKENNILWGCDMCAEGCPDNKSAELTYIKEFISGYKDSYDLADDILGRAFEWRGKEVIKRNFENLSDNIPDVVGVDTSKSE